MSFHLRPRDHEDAPRVAISWLSERHRKGWRKASEDLLEHWRPEGPQGGWPLDEDGMTMVSINAGEWLIARGQIHARGGLRDINKVLDGAAALKLHGENARDLMETELARAWLAQWLDPAPLPKIVDSATGEPLLLVTDHYRVHNAAALAAALAAQADVSGDAQHGWHRMAPSDNGLQRNLCAINPGSKADRIEVFYRTQRLADEGRAWFEALAGSAAQYLTRRFTDPMIHLSKAHKPGSAATPARAASAASNLPPEVLAQTLDEFVHRHYANWCDETIPALGGLSPRQAITTAAGLERVKGLLREYEAGELQQSSAQGRPATSYQFLWDALAISR